MIDDSLQMIVLQMIDDSFHIIIDLPSTLQLSFNFTTIPINYQLSTFNYQLSTINYHDDSFTDDR